MRLKAENDRKSEPEKPWYLYILECAGEKLYTGIALDVDARFEAHRAGRGAKFTRSYPPLRIALVRRFASRGEALKEEHAVKKLSPAAKRELIRTVATPEPHRKRQAK